MRDLRKLLLASAAAALAITTLGAPASAADTTGTIAMVNGVPGTNVDVCIGNKEKASGLPYGAYFHQKVIGTGPKLVRFFKKNPARKCGGTLLGRKYVNVTPGWDRTLVVTKKNPNKVVVFDNASPFLGAIPPLGAAYTNGSGGIRHAADFPANIDRTAWESQGNFVVTPFPSAPAVWTKGMQWVVTNGFIPEWIQGPNAYVVGGSDPIAQTLKRIQPSIRYEWILLGSGPGNAKWATLKRRISQPTP